ncbi:c-type cytochrome [Octadecabacter sp. R77987]|uniref:c-type cytochrome n=1 Tax=Octadecabacter sp. R77987 TaxID=3093874 RepID=UPI0036715D18
MRTPVLAGLTAAAVSIGALVGADGHISAEQIETSVNARQSHMQLYSFHIATLGGMAQDKMPYDAAAATAAADSIVALTTLSQSRYWLPGSDSESFEGSRALPAIWAEGSDVGDKGAAFVEAALAMQAVAGTDLDALKAAMGPLGGACGDCHRNYRVRNE